MDVDRWRGPLSGIRQKTDGVLTRGSTTASYHPVLARYLDCNEGRVPERNLRLDSAETTGQNGRYLDAGVQPSAATIPSR
jgi:hypothetical protein